MKITRRKTPSYVKDLPVKFEDDKNRAMFRLKMPGWSDEEISDKLRELRPEAKKKIGMHASVVTSRFLSPLVVGGRGFEPPTPAV
jgi:hypothetical protein